MNEAINSVIGFVIGCAVGWFAHIIFTTLRETKKEVDELLEIERRHDERGILQHRLAFNVTFGFTILFVLISASLSIKNNYELKQNQHEDFVNVCHAAENIRDVQRSTVDEVYELATGFINPQQTRTRGEIVATNRYIDRANKFRNSSYEDIKPTPPCLPYVTDEHKLPPTAPFPHVK